MFSNTRFLTVLKIILDTVKKMPARTEIGGQIPFGILAIILKYDGRLGHDLQLDYIGGIYIHVYRSILGWIPQPETDTLQFLQLANHLYSSKIQVGSRLGPIRKDRPMRKHMVPWRKAFGKDLNTLLKYIECDALLKVEPWPRNVVELMC